MKIAKIEAVKVAIHEKETFKLALAEIDVADSVFVKITTDDGITGYGEGTPFAPVTGETGDTVLRAIELFTPALIGKNPFDLEGVHALMDSILHHNSSAKCAIDIALYDIIGKAAGQPLYRLLGGDNNSLVTDVTIGISTPEHMAELAADWVSKGYKILKIKAGLNLDHDLKALSLIRKAAGDDVRIRVDLNQACGIAGTMARYETFVKLGIDAIEQPCPSWDIKGMAELKNKTGQLLLMADESLSDEHDALMIAENRCADIVNLKLMKCGGIYPALKINSIAEAAGINCMVGCMFEDRIAITAAMSLVAAKRNITEADCDSFLLSDYVSIPVSGGFTNNGQFVTLLDKPGLGVEVDF